MLKTESSIVDKIKIYLKHFRKEDTKLINFLDKGAILRTDARSYYVKFDTMYWVLAGRETGKFAGAGFAVNSKYYNLIHDMKLDILYFNSPNYIYYYTFKNYEQNSFNHMQSYNSERVRVISIENADDVWLI